MNFVLETNGEKSVSDGIKCQITGFSLVVSKTCIQQTIKHYNKFGTVTDWPRTGCPMKTSLRQDCKLLPVSYTHLDVYKRQN